MQRYFDVVQSPSGDAIVGGLVSVFIGGTTTLATLYVDNGVTLSPNPVTTNTDGEYAFYAANGTYTLQITATNYATEVKPGVVMFDPSDNVSFGNNVTLVAGTANGVLYLNGSKVATSGSALVFDGNNLGIGTSSPGYKFEVVGPSNSYVANFRTNSGTAANDSGVLFINASSATAASRSSQIVLDPNGANGIGGDYAYLLMTGDGTATFGNQFNGALVFSGATERMRLDASGNLGLGVTPSAWNAAFKGVELNNGAFLATTNGPYLTYNAYFSSNWLYKTNAAASHYLQTGGEHHWYNAPPGTAGNLITFTQAMTLDLSGRLGIGTTSPGANLQIGASTSGSQVLAFAYSATSAGSIDFRANGSSFGAGWIQHDAASGALRFATAGSERARFDSSGNLIQTAPTTPPTLSTNGTMVFNLTSNTNLRVSVRGSDGTTRTANFTLV